MCLQIIVTLTPPPPLPHTEHFCSVTPAELLQKVSVIPKPPSKQPTVGKSADRGSLSPDGENTTAIKRLAHRFNQVC